MVVESTLNTLRDATINDVGGILQLLQPLEAEGILVRRGRELLEREIGRFVVLEHDRIIIGCAALYPFADEKSAELACLAVQPRLPAARLRRCAAASTSRREAKAQGSAQAVRADHAHRALVRRARLQGNRYREAARAEETALQLPAAFQGVRESLAVKTGIVIAGPAGPWQSGQA